VAPPSHPGRGRFLVAVFLRQVIQAVTPVATWFPQGLEAVGTIFSIENKAVPAVPRVPTILLSNRHLCGKRRRGGVNTAIKARSPFPNQPGSLIIQARLAMRLRIVCAAPDASEAELEAKFPGRRERLQAWDSAVEHHRQ